MVSHSSVRNRGKLVRAERTVYLLQDEHTNLDR